jgi:hypothetical protein
MIQKAQLRLRESDTINERFCRSFASPLKRRYLTVSDHRGGTPREYTAIPRAHPWYGKAILKAKGRRPGLIAVVN